ncbi:MAG: hypothetical protein HY042_06980 [Spirochaetia bacterium]|nr:hypothetical protein [Spirochaetia bacterium]
MKADPRAAALIIAAKLHSGLSAISEEDGRLSHQTARDLIINAIRLLPDIQVTESDGTAYISFAGLAGSAPVPLQDAVDSLVTVWNEYEERAEVGIL